MCASSVMFAATRRSVSGLPALAHRVEERGEPLGRHHAAPDQDLAEVLAAASRHGVSL